MESEDSQDLPDRISAGMSYLDAMKVVALPFATVAGIAGVILWFAADAWIRSIVQEEMTGVGTESGEHGMTLAKHAGTLAQHDEEIEDNEDDIERHDERFTAFVREILSRP